jgi:flagellar biosynthetic protein FliR
LLGLLVLLSINGHLMMIATLAQSFEALPIGATALGAQSWSNIASAGTIIFASGLLLALPVVCALLITNIALAVLSRAAPQLSLFSIGFPLTLLGGFAVLILMLGNLSTPLMQLFEHGLRSMLGHFVRA